MTTISSFFKSCRISKGLTRGKLAALAGYRNLSKGAGRVWYFETTGRADYDFVTKLASALCIDKQTLDRLIEQDRQECLAEWEAWSSTLIRKYIVIRLMSAFYTSIDLPVGITQLTDAETFTANVARQRKKRCCLVWSRRLSVFFDEHGQLERRQEAKPGEDIQPCMMVGNHKFMPKESQP